MAFNCFYIDMPLSLLVIPFLIPGFPYLPFAALPADEGLVYVIFRQRSVGIYMRELADVRRNRRRMCFSLGRMELRYPLRLSEFLAARISTRV